MTCQLPKIYLPQFYEGLTILQYRRYPEIITRKQKSTDRKYNVPQYSTNPTKKNHTHKYKENPTGLNWAQTSRNSKQVMIATVNISKWWPTILPPGTLGSFAETLYQENHELKHKLWNIISTQLLCIYRYAEVSRWKNIN